MSAEAILIAHLDESGIGYQKSYPRRGTEIKFDILLGRDEHDLMIFDPYRVTFEVGYIFIDSWGEGEGTFPAPDWKVWGTVTVDNFRLDERWQNLMKRIANAPFQKQ